MARGDFTNSKGERVHIDLIPADREGKTRVRMVVERGPHMAMYSDFFGSLEIAEKWASDIVVAYGGFTPDHWLCERCGSPIYPWAETGDTESAFYHKACWLDELSYCSLCEGTNGNHVPVDIRFLETSDGTSTLNTWRDDHNNGRTTLLFTEWVNAHKETSC